MLYKLNNVKYNPDMTNLGRFHEIFVYMTFLYIPRVLNMMTKHF